jgi:hypothetical protein
MWCVSNSVYHNRERCTQKGCTFFKVSADVQYNRIYVLLRNLHAFQDQAHFNEQVEEMKI